MSSQGKMYEGRRIRKKLPEQSEEKTSTEVIAQSDKVQEIRLTSRESLLQTENRENVSIQEENSTISNPNRDLTNHERSILNSPISRCIDMHLRYTQTNNLIGVFGTNSDREVNNALRDIQTRSSVICLNKTQFYKADVYTMFAAVMYTYIDESKLWLRMSRPEQARGQIYRYLQQINCPDIDDWDDGFSMLSKMRAWFERGEKCKEFLRFIKQQLGNPNIKFIWNIDTGFEKIQLSLLQGLEEMLGEDIIIILNSCFSIDIHANSLASELSYSHNSSQEGYNLIYKYFGYGNVLMTN